MQAPLNRPKAPKRANAGFAVKTSEQNSEESILKRLQAIPPELRGSTEPFGGMCVLFSGDFHQTMPVIRRSSAEQQANASLKRSSLWKDIIKFGLSVNVCLGRKEGQSNDDIEANAAFGKWLLDLGDGKLQSEDYEKVNVGRCNVTNMGIEEQFSMPLVTRHYKEAHMLIEQQNWWELGDYYSSKCILTPLNRDVAGMNTAVLGSIDSHFFKYVSLDQMDKDYVEEVSPALLNSFDLPSFSKHELLLKPGVPVILLRNLNLAQGLCNGTRLIVSECGKTTWRCRIVSGRQRGKMIMMPKIKLYHPGDDVFPVPFYRYQFPVSLAFAMTINKAQGQSLDNVLVVLPNKVFAHGQLYVGLSRCTSSSNVSVCLGVNSGDEAFNIVDWAFVTE